MWYWQISYLHQGAPCSGSVTTVDCRQRVFSCYLPLCLTRHGQGLIAVELKLECHFVFALTACPTRSCYSFLIHCNSNMPFTRSISKHLSISTHCTTSMQLYLYCAAAIGGVGCGNISSVTLSDNNTQAAHCMAKTSQSMVLYI